VARAGLDAARVVAAAADIADAEGLEAVTLARLAAALGVRSPSLYNHVAGLDALLRGIALAGLAELGAALREAAVGRAGTDALVAAAHAYRDYALAHPGRYAAGVRAPEPGDEEHEAAAGAVVGVMAAVLRGWDLDEEETVHALRAWRSAVHGFVSLETAGGFGIPVDLDTSFDRLVGSLAAGLERRAG
jgi:AcrR family transcriptional regulator